jgi:HAD superfamily hydrolase (TIGR01509 family)
MEVPVLMFEFEGVLVETAELRTRALAEALAADGIELTVPLISLSRGRTTEQAIACIRDAVGAPDDPTAVELARLRAERAFAGQVGKGVRLTPGAREALERLTSCARLSLVTRASRREVEFVLTLAGLDGMFRPIVCAEDAVPAKPSPAPYQVAMQRVAQLFPGQTLRGLAVEDTVLGVHAAREAGMQTVIVGQVQPQHAMEADAWVETLVALTPERVRLLLGLAAKGA